MLKLVNRTNHILIIDYRLTIDPRGSVLIRYDQCTEHIKQLERNGFINIEVVKVEEPKKVSNPSIANVQPSNNSNASRKTSNKKKTK